MEDKLYPSGRVYYYKLVRDRIPELMQERQATFEVQMIEDDAQFEVELMKKLAEEAEEVITATDKEGTMCELADLLDVIDAVKAHKKISDDELAAARKKQFAKKGGFKKRLMLVWSENP